MNMMVPARLRLVVVGNGMAGMRTVEEILARTPHRFSITVFGAEPHPNYNRIMLSPVLAREKTFDEIVINPREWYEQNGIELITGERVWHVDREERTVQGEHGTTRPYDMLLIATGSNPFILPLVGRDLPGVIGFRDVADVETMLAAAARGGRAVVIGGGLLGLEAANGLALAGMDVTIVHLMDTLMERQLDPASGAMLQADLERRGMTVLCGAHTKLLRGSEEGVSAVELKDGTVLPADLVVMAVGIRPNTELGVATGLEVKRGIVVDDQMRTSDPSIFAVGECVEHRGLTYGLVAPIWDMAKVCADAVTGVAETAYSGSVTGTRLKVTGIDMFSAGDFAPGVNREEVVFRDPARGVYRRLVLEGDRLIGAVLYGDARDGGWYFGLLKDAKPLGELRDTLIFGQDVATAATGADSERGLGGTARHGRDLRLQRRLQGHNRRGDRRQGADHARCGARPHQGVLVLRQLHAAGRGPARDGARRWLQGAGWGKAVVQVHRARPRHRQGRDPGAAAEDDSRGDGGIGLGEGRWLPRLPSGAELLPAVRLARRIRG